MVLKLTLCLLELISPPGWGKISKWQSCNGIVLKHRISEICLFDVTWGKKIEFPDFEWQSLLLHTS